MLCDFRMDTGGEKDLCFFLGIDVGIFREIWALITFYPQESVAQTGGISIPFSDLFLNEDSLGFIMVCHIGCSYRDESGEIGP